MAKAQRTKKVEEEKIETPETPIEQPESTEPVAETPTEEIPPSVTLDEVKEMEKAESDLVVKEVIPEPEKPVEVSIQPEVLDAIKSHTPEPAKVIINENLSMADKILAFVESKSGEVRLNEFIRSTYPPTKFSEPAKYFHQQESRVIRAALDVLVKEGKIVIKNNAHLMLGDFYYEGGDPQTKHWNLNTVEIIAVK